MVCSGVLGRDTHTEDGVLKGEPTSLKVHKPKTTPQHCQSELGFIRKKVERLKVKVLTTLGQGPSISQTLLTFHLEDCKLSLNTAKNSGGAILKYFR